MTTAEQEAILPNRLSSGDVLVTKTGCKVTVCGRGKNDREGEPTYRLQYESGIRGNERWSRDRLQAEGVTLTAENWM